MININLMDDDELRGTVNSFISALLPHDNFDPTMFATVLETIYKYVHLDEFKLEHRLILETLSDLNRIKISVSSFEPRLTRDVFEHILEAGIMDAIVRPDLGVTSWLSYEGMNTNLSIQTVREEACQHLCQRALELYDECYEEAESTDAILNREPELRSAFLAHASTQCINAQAEILQNEARVGRRVYRGASDWLEYTMKTAIEVKNRIQLADSNDVVQIDSVEGSFQLLKKLQELCIPIADYGIPELDQYTPILRHRLVVVVGMENIGKTKFAIDETVNVIRTGGKVAYMCGESQKAEVYASILINYIWKEYGLIVRNEHLAAPDLCPDDVRKIIGMATDKVVRSGGLVLCDAFNYATLYSELQTLYESTKFDMVVIDHSCALVGTVGDGSLKAKIDKLAEDARDFKKKFPVCIMVTSHPSTTGKQTAKAGKQTDDSPTKGSQNLSTEADEVLYLRDNETLQKQNLIMLENTKRRNAGRIIEPIILRKKFEVNTFVYEADIQGGEAKTSLQREEALRVLNEQCNIEDEDMYSID